MMRIYRHGDLTIKECQKRETESSGVNVKLALGEATGHHHTLQNNVRYSGVEGAVNYFEIDEETFLFHQQHVPNEKWDCLVAAGCYEIVIEREYDYFENELRKVVD